MTFVHATNRWLAHKKRSFGIIGALLIITIYGALHQATSMNEVILSLNQDPSSNVLRYLIRERNVTDDYPLVTPESTTNTDVALLDYDRSHIKYIYPEVIQSIYNSTDLDRVDWSKYAYVLYATSTSHMCNAMMICAELRQYGTRAELVMLVKKEFLTKPEEFKYEHDTLTAFSIQYNVTLKETEVIQKGGDDVNIWLSSYTKLMVFNEIQYDRIIYMDSDALLTRGHLDELFFIPPCKMAVSTAYWHTKRKYDEMGADKIKELYPPQQYGFTPLTIEQREAKLNKFIDENVYSFLHDDPKLAIQTRDKQHTAKTPTQHDVNRKNFYTNIYNNLPNYVTNDEFDLTNIVMVIQPTPELFELVLKAIDEKKKGEFDMELVQYHLFDFKDIIPKQKAKYYTDRTDISFNERLDEVPEFLILPHQVYGTITHELNLHEDHVSFMADSHEQVFAHLREKTSTGEPAYYEIEHMERPGDYYYEKLKYLHYSDAPIPKPWYYFNPKANYMGHRNRCDSHPDYHTEGIMKPTYGRTKDCSNAKNWEESIKTFTKLRKDVCGLDLIVTDEDTYYKLIN